MCRRVQPGLGPPGLHGLHVVPAHVPRALRRQLLLIHPVPELREVLVLDVGEVAPEAGAEGGLGHVVVDGQHRQLVHEDGLGGLQHGHALGRVELRGRVAHQPVVVRVAPAGLVVLAAGDEQVHEVVGVRVVADPGGARDVVADVGLGVEVHLPLLVQELGVDAQVLGPRVRDDERDLHVRVGGVVVDLDRGEGLAAGTVAGFCHQPLGLRHVRLVARPVGHVRVGVPREAGGHEGVGGDLAGLGDLLADVLARDGEGQGAPHERVVQGRLGDVDSVEVRAQVGDRVEVLPGHQLLDDVGRRHVDPVALPREVEVERRRVRLHGQGVDRLEGDVVRVPVAGVLDEADAVVHAAELHHVGPVADDVLGAQPLLLPAVGEALLGLLDVAAVHREHRVEGHELQEERRGRLQPEAERVLIGRGDPDGVEPVHGAAVLDLGGEGLGALDVPEHVGVLGRRLGVEEALEGPHEVRRGDLVAVGPEGVVAQVERVLEAVVRDLPPLCDPWERFKCLRVRHQEALKEHPDGPPLRHPGHGRGVQGLDLGAVVEHEVSGLEAGPAGGVDRPPEEARQEGDGDHLAGDALEGHGSSGATGEGAGAGRV